MKTVRMTRRAGFTLTDVAVGLAAVVFLVALAVPAAHLATERERRQRCAGNLRSIALACIMYASNEVRTGSFPRTYFNTTSGAVTEYTGANAADSFGPGGPSPNDVTASLYLVLKTQEITPEVFVCPGSDADPFPGPVPDHSNWPSRQYLGYSYACPFATAGGLNSAIGNGWKFNNSLGSDYPLVSDMNPGVGALLTTPYSAGRKEMAAVNTPSHEGDGQNVVYADAHVEFQQTPYCGVPRVGPNNAYVPYRDNIFTVGLGGVKGSSPGGSAVKGLPLDVQDMVMLPTIADGTQPPAKSHLSDMTMFGAAGGLLLLVVLIVVAYFVFRKKPAAPPMAGRVPGGYAPPGYGQGYGPQQGYPPPQGYAPPPQGYPPPGPQQGQPPQWPPQAPQQ